MADARECWKKFCDSLGLERDVADDMFAQLAKRYANPVRYQHTLEGHIAECIGEFALIKEFSNNPIEVEAAIWAHDACYDTHSHTNEEESADWGVEFYSPFGSRINVAKVARLIMMTKTHLPGDRDEQILSDCDLAKLGKPEKEFDEYERNIRREYEWVPEAIFREHRANFLEEFLKRPQIYYIKLFKDRYENQARVNMVRSISFLRSNKPLL